MFYEKRLSSQSVPGLDALFRNKKTGGDYCRPFFLYARGESNPNRRNRNPIFYPLNYGRIFPICVGKSTK